MTELADLRVLLPDSEQYEQMDSDGNRYWVTTRVASVFDLIAALQSEGVGEVVEPSEVDVGVNDVEIEGAIWVVAGYRYLVVHIDGETETE